MNRFNYIILILLMSLLLPACRSRENKPAARETAAGKKESYSSNILQEGQIKVTNRLTEAEKVQLHYLFRQADSLTEVAAIDSSIRIYEQAEALALKGGDADAIAEALLHNSACRIQKAQYQAAMQLALKAMSYIARAEGKERLKVLWYIRIAAAHAYTYNQDSAIIYLLKASNEMHRIKDTLLLIPAYNYLGGLWALNKREDKALFYLQQAEALSLAMNTDKHLGYIYGNLSTLYYDLKDTAHSFAYAKKQLESGIRKNNKVMQAIGLMGMGIPHLRSEPGTALQHFKKAEEYLRGNDVRTRYFLFVNEGIAHYHLGNLKKTRNCFLQAEALLRKFDTKGIQGRTLYNNLYLLYKEMNDYKHASLYLEKYLILNDSLSSLERNKVVDQLEIKYRIAQKDKALTAQQLTIVKAESKLKQKNIWILSIGGGALLSLVTAGLFFYRYRSSLERQRYQVERMRSLEKEQELNQLVSLMKGEESERLRIARELHDGIGGMLANTRLNIGVLSEEFPALKGRVSFDRIVHMLENTSAEVRKTSHNLMPDVLVRYSLNEAVMMYCESLDTGDNLDIDFQHHGDTEGLSKEIQLFLYRIVQELLQNVLKHAQATAVSVQLLRYDNTVSITVEDNGIGFPADHTSNYGIGLSNIYARVEALNGIFSINAPPGAGTTVLIQFDYDELNKISEKIEPLHKA